MGCRRVASQGDLLRLVAADGDLTPDPVRRLPGRGAYVHADTACLERALKRRAFARALRAPVAVEAETLEWIDEWRRSASPR